LGRYGGSHHLSEDQVTALANEALFIPSHNIEEKTQSLTKLDQRSTTTSEVDLVRRATVADERALSEMSLSQLWKELSLGLCKIVDTFFTRSRCTIVTVPAPGPAVPLEGRRLEILEAVLCGEGQKRIAIELGLAPSTVALNARLALNALGVSCRPSRVHPLLMLSAKAASTANLRVTGSLSFLNHGDDLFRVVGTPRPDLELSDLLPPAELAVVRCLVEGASYAQIARERGTSTRTIANQITAVFRRMKVSGRSELLLRLFSGEAGLRRASMFEAVVAPTLGCLERASGASQ
jgi:DNA-binding NarL/FixJ family response regulator